MKFRVHFLPILTLCCFFSTSVKAQISTAEYEQKLDKGIEAFYQTQWDSAGTIFGELKKLDEANPSAFFFDAMIPFWEYFFAGQETQIATHFLNLSQQAIEKSSNQLSENPHDTTMVLMLSGLHGYRSLVAASEKEYRRAIQSGMTGYKYTRQLLAIDDDDPKALIGKGIFYYMIGNVPGEFRWVTNMMGIKGDKKQGFDILEKAAKAESYVSNDAQMVLVYLYKEEGRFEEALAHIKDLRDQYSDNIIFQFTYAELLEKANRPVEARQAYRQVVDMENNNLHALKDQSRIRLQQL